MFLKSLFALFIVLSVVAAEPIPAGMRPGGPWQGGGVNPWIPPWVMLPSWYPQWSPCTTIGSSCLDCNTRMVCTKIGGIQKPCSDPSLPHCNLGECSATPSEECAPATESNVTA